MVWNRTVCLHISVDHFYSVLTWDKTCFRYNVQLDYEAEDSVLYCELDNPLRRNHFLDSSRILPTFGLWGESHAVYFNSTLTDCVFFAAGRNYSAYVIGGTAIRKVPTLYDDTGNAIHIRHGVCSQRTFPVS